MPVGFCKEKAAVRRQKADVSAKKEKGQEAVAQVGRMTVGDGGGVQI